MVGTYELVVEILGPVLALGVVVICARQGFFSRYLILNLYLLTNVVFTLGCYYVRSLHGYTSLQYFYFYYTGDAIVTVINYVLIGSFFNYMFRHSVFRKYVQLTISFFFVGVVIVSGMFISGNVDRFYSSWMIEFEQNMYFVGVLLKKFLTSLLLRRFSRPRPRGQWAVLPMEHDLDFHQGNARNHLCIYRLHVFLCYRWTRFPN